ncbi:hypothetical protein [Lactobacillus sp. 3B(2020)]|uniref:hypothetical protein n=1 Tax=Lactobacillus sp. 3B(2020) TaxID=2695882 RepID=UPI0015DDC70D|nr:hypothetical protein [Lactobacillus sp. 3B(2020)]QLL69583.1 hypothetical protein GTO83_03015 [Lactobacillus sp. 3B(2020)]
MMLVRGRVEKQGKKFIIHNPSMPNFDDYISDLAVMFDMYPTKDDRQLHEVRKAIALIDDFQRVTGQAVELVTPMKGRFRVALLGHKGIFERKDVNYKIEE